MILLHVRLFIVQETSRNVACTIPKMTRISKNIIFMKDNNYLSTRVALLNTSVLFPTQHSLLIFHYKTHPCTFLSSGDSSPELFQSSSQAEFVT